MALDVASLGIDVYRQRFRRRPGFRSSRESRKEYWYEPVPPAETIRAGEAVFLDTLPFGLPEACRSLRGFLPRLSSGSSIIRVWPSLAP